MFTIKNWQKSEEITLYNFFKQEFTVFKDDEYFIHIHPGMCGMSESRLYFDGKIKEALTITLNNIADEGLRAVSKLESAGLERWNNDIFWE